MQVKQLLGHRSLKTTQVYTRVSVGEMQATHRKAHPSSRRRQAK
jgi:site-specific recombinase XerD